ncbi:MAG: indolepyruvate ferredoxin oxidoreductase [Bacteroidales bacterium]|nr:indolepyruvate ferredoxin oxidoreductase [Bacteroidales bacterium]
MNKLLLLGDEAIAQAAIDGGMSGVYAYPGTPSTEITEYIQRNKTAKEKNIHSEWSTNEKTAMESAIGMSYAGKRSMVCMKHVGLNVAADAFMNSAITGVNGGMLIVVADDPSMHSSQNEQDSRYFADFALIPILEPSNQQEAYDMIYGGFELSEKFNTPIMVRITTRLAHSRASITRKAQIDENKNSLPSDLKQFVLLPAIARKNYKTLIGNQVHFENSSEQSSYNQYFEGKDKSLGIIAAGISFNYLIENYEDRNVPYPVLKIGQYPLPSDSVRKIYEECDKILILEDGYPFIENKLTGVLGDKKIKGRLTGDLPRDGELNPNFVAVALGLEEPIIVSKPDVLQNRPPSLCPGCGHTDVFIALNEVMADYGSGRVFSDIGCYTLAALPPLNAVNSCVDMGASITMAKGAADAGMKHVIAFIGDSTFTHSGMTGLLDCVYEKTPITVIISDNDTTAMTGGQASHAEHMLQQICKGLGVEEGHIRSFIPLKKNHDEALKILREEIEYEGVSVIIPHRECVRTLEKKHKLKAKIKKMK